MQEALGIDMKRVRSHNIIYLIIISVIMISGICQEKIPAGSYFSCKEEKVLQVYGNDFESVSACKTETLSQKEVLFSIRLAKRQEERNNIRERHMFMPLISGAYSLPQNFHFYLSAKENRLYYEMLYSIAILNYIHNQDGEKV